MSTYANGCLPPAALRAIGGGLFLERVAGEAYLAMDRLIAAKRGRPLALNAAYRTLAKQHYLYAGYVARRPGFNLAAVPGTSNHGWGLAIDLGTPADRAAVNAYGAPYGWSKVWSDAPSEWWHIRFNAQVWSHNRGRLGDPLAGLLADEKAWLTQYLQLKRTGAEPKQRRALWHRLKRRRQAIWRTAEHGGWSDATRTRYRLIHHYIGG